MSKTKEPDYETFWKQIQEETGSPVLYKSIVRILELPADSQWALFYGTESHCYFQFFEKTNWLSALMNKGPKGENSVCDIPYDAVVSSVFIPERNFLKIFRFGEGRIIFQFSRKIQINSDLCTDSVTLVPVTPVTELQKSIPLDNSGS